MPCTIRYAHGSNYKVLSEWDPGPTYVVQRLWDPGGPSFSESSMPTYLETLGQLKSYLDYSTTIPTIPSCPNVNSSCQTPPREARPYREVQVPT